MPTDGRFQWPTHPSSAPLSELAIRAPGSRRAKHRCPPCHRWLCFGPILLFDRAAGILSPRPRSGNSAAHLDAVKVGRRSVLDTSSNASRPHLEGVEHGSTLIQSGRVGALGWALITKSSCQCPNQPQIESFCSKRRLSTPRCVNPKNGSWPPLAASMGRRFNYWMWGCSSGRGHETWRRAEFSPFQPGSRGMREDR